MHGLVQARVDVAHIHFVGPEGMDMTELHAANVWQTSDVLRAAKAGWVIGSACGIVLGLASALMFPDMGDDPAWEMALPLAILGGLVGAWSASMIGISIPSPGLQRFEGALAQGHVVLMVDLPRSRVQDIEALLRTAHPEARFEGEGRQQILAFR